MTSLCLQLKFWIKITEQKNKCNCLLSTLLGPKTVINVLGFLSIIFLENKKTRHGFLETYQFS